MAHSGLWDRVTEQTMPSTAVTHLHLFRHGKPDTGAERRCYGHLDLPLRRRGEEQHAVLAALAREGRRFPRPDGVLSSDLLRCRRLGEALADAWQVPLIVDARLREQHMGDWEGRTWSELTQSDVAGVRAYWTDYASTRPPGGESLADARERVVAALADHWPRMEGGRWAVASHAGVLRIVLCEALGLPLDQGLRFSPLPGSHTWLMMAQAGAVVQLMGERPLGDDAGVASRARKVAVSAAVRPPCLALSGSAGTGKTTLGRALSARFDLPYIPEGMRERIEAGLVLKGLSHDELRELIFALWREWRDRCEEARQAHGGFIADRSPVDFMAFWMHYHFAREDELTVRLFEECRAELATLDRVLVLPHGAIPLVADGVRSTDPWLQRRYQALLEGLVVREVPEGRTAWLPALTAREDRVEWVVDLWTESMRHA
jgi:broad specificity phosphatase PhoE/nicotinamide riboside kinase